MDTICKRYGSPFLILDEMIAMGQLSEFIDELCNYTQEDTLWEIYVHNLISMNGKSFSDFKDEVLNAPKEVVFDDKKIEATINDSFEMLNGFTP